MQLFWQWFRVVQRRLGGFNLAIEPSVRCGVMGLGLWLVLTLNLAAQATNWQAIAHSTDGNSLQYVDLDSLVRQGPVTQLETYWLDRAQPAAKTYATTEYHCDRQQYRDLALNGQPQQQDWHSIEQDELNQRVLEFACQQESP